MKVKLLAVLVAVMALVFSASPALASGSGWYHSPMYYTQGVDEWMYCEDYGALYCYIDRLGYWTWFSSSYPNVVMGG